MWKNRRRMAALAQALVILGLPFLRVGGESALRFDIPELKLHVFGAVLWIDQFPLVLLGTLFALLFAAGATVLFGRVWCGYSCPQTVIPELAAWGASFLPARWKDAGKTCLLLPLSAVASLSLLWYFIPPAEAVSALFRSRIVLSFFLAQGAVIFGMLAFAGTGFCRTVCPYSMLQNALFDGNTLTIAFDEYRKDECLRCDLCVSVCPVAIDIKRGLARECIACAECIDACLRMTGPIGIRPFIGYRGKIVRGKALLFSAFTVLACLAFAGVWYLRPPVAFSVQWTGMESGADANVYRYLARNNGGNPLELALNVEGGRMTTGERTIRLGPHARSSGVVAVRKGRESGGQITFVVSGSGVLLRREAGFP
jgi:polyferredoxin